MNVNFKPLEPEQLNVLDRLAESLETEQLIWANGYLQGLIGSRVQGNHATLTDQQSEFSLVNDPIPVTVLYGTHTGNCEQLANQFKEVSADFPVDVRIVSMDDFRARDIKKEKNLLVIVSTHGEGEPPLMAEDFHSYVTGGKLPELTDLNFSVLALGDTSYRLFCQTGIDINNALRATGANEVLPIVTCDVDFEESAEEWMQNVLSELSRSKISEPVHVLSAKKNGTPLTQYSKKNPFRSTVLEKVRITGSESDKEVYHLELDLEGSGLTYEPGDALGVVAQNPPQLVNAIIDKLGVDQGQSVETKFGTTTFEEALTRYYEITILNRTIIQNYSDKTGLDQVKALFENENQLDEYLYDHDILDLLCEFPAKFSASEFLELLRPLPPRLYSISSSQKAVGEEVHITVARVNYKNKGRERLGACSSFLADRINQDDELLIYIDKNPNFKLPANGTPLIMVGAGTGIAPYRGFLQDREAEDKKGKTWLFFGERTFYSDFLYQVEWQKHLDSGQLEKIDLAFSRDQEQKIYVQHRLKEKKEEVFEWLENGANFYLCGDMRYMAKDVQETLEEIISEQGGLSPENAGEYLKKLKKEKRFQLDVY